MTTWIIIGIIVAAYLVGGLFGYCLCKVAKDADEQSDRMYEQLKGEIK